MWEALKNMVADTMTTVADAEKSTFNIKANVNLHAQVGYQLVASIGRCYDRVRESDKQNVPQSMAAAVVNAVQDYWPSADNKQQDWEELFKKDDWTTVGKQVKTGLANKRHNFQINSMEIANTTTANKLTIVGRENIGVAVTKMQNEAARNQNPAKQAEQVKGAADTQALSNIEETQEKTLQATQANLQATLQATKQQQIQHQQLITVLEKGAGGNRSTTNRPSGESFQGTCYNWGHRAASC